MTLQQLANSEIIIADCDDWEGLYIDGKLVAQDHRIDWVEILRHAGVNIAQREVSCDYLDRRSGELDSNIDNVEWIDED